MYSPGFLAINASQTENSRWYLLVQKFPGISLASLDFLISSLVTVLFLMQLELTVKLHSDKVGLARRE